MKKVRILIADDHVLIRCGGPKWFEKFDPITADFTYVHWLGDLKGIEQQTRVWDKMIVDRSAELAEWVEVLKTVHKRKIQILAFANNHYALCRRRHKAYNAAFRIMPN